MAETAAKPRKTAAATDIQVGAAAPAHARKGLFDDARSQVSDFRDQAATAARNAATTGKDKAAEALGAVSEFAEDVARTIDDKVGGGYGDYARRTGQSVTGFADRLRASDVDDLVEDTKQFVRKSPAIAIGVAAAFGFLLTRLIKAGASGSRS